MLFLKYISDTAHSWLKIAYGIPKPNNKVRLENNMGGGFDYIIEDNDLICDVESIYDLDWESVLVNPASKYEYIDPDGNWYGCDFEYHYDLCKYVLRLDNPEEYGWVKVYRGSFEDITYYSRRKFLTEAQIKTLTDRGVEVSEFDTPEFYHTYVTKYGNEDLKV